MPIILSILSLVLFGWLFYYKWQKSRWKLPTRSFPKEWSNILEQKVDFYRGLTQQEKENFEIKIDEFLLNCRITGIKTEVEDTDRILVAAGAVIPIFNFPKWRYSNLFEVLLYPAHFNENFEITGVGRNILGMVGTGYMEGKMILSKRALHHGFEITSDKKNTALHEFVHLIDKTDGIIDGIPNALLERPYTIPWLNVISVEMNNIYTKKSKINPYGGTNKQEFFAVASEYFFEKPKLMQSQHPELYDMLEEIYNQDMSMRQLHNKKYRIGRNSVCPCGSGVKFKNCCSE